MKVPFVNFGKQYEEHKYEFDEAIKRVLSGGNLILREDVEEFERNFADFLGVKYVVGVNSGTDALYLALKALEIGFEDEVLVSSHTFVASIQVINQLGATPVLYDLEEDLKIGKKTKVIMLCHISGELDHNLVPALNIGLPIVEDACQALGAELEGKKAGTMGDIGAFSFYPAKLLGCFGDGGALVTDNEDIYEEVKELRNHYKKDYSKWGINSRLDNLQAAVLNIRLKYLSQILERRKQIAERYLQEINIDKIRIKLPAYSEGRVWQDFILYSCLRDELFSFLKFHGIETMKNEYPFPIEKLPKSAEYEENTLRIPCNETLTDSEVDYIIKNINKF